MAALPVTPETLHELARLQQKLRELDREAAARRAVEEALRQSERQYRDLVETSNDLIWSVDVDGRFTFLNRNATRRIFGREPETMLGRPFTEFEPPEQVALDLEAFRKVKEGHTFVAEETILLRADGTRVHLKYNAMAVRDERGIVVGTTGTATDITELKRTLAALEESEELFRTLFDSAAVGMAQVGSDNRFVRVNQRLCDLLGYTRDELLSRTVFDVSHPDDVPRNAELVRRAVEGDIESYGMEKRYVRKDGAIVWGNLSVAIVRDAEGALRFRIATVEDVTERRRAEQERRALELQVQQAQKLESLGLLAGGVAHDFNNILTTVLGNADLALMHVLPGSESAVAIEQVVLGAQRAAELTRQLLAYSGRGRFVVQAIALRDVVHEMGHLLQVSLPRSCTLRCEFADDTPAVVADAAQLRQVALNLILNAAEAIGEKGGTVTLRTAAVHCTRADLAAAFGGEKLPEGRYALLEVADDGCGMSAETAARIFDPFFSTKFAGRGLGLAAVQGIVRAHRGAIRVSSTLGAGSTFRVVLPASDQPARSTVAPVSPPISWRGSGVALVVDDEADVRDVARAMLARMGFDVLTAGDGPAAKALFARHVERVKLVLLDYTMPGEDGEEVFRELRKLRADVAVIFTSGYAQPAASGGLPRAERSTFVEKPYRFEALRAAVRELVR